jgi:hypothetical protein
MDIFSRKGKLVNEQEGRFNTAIHTEKFGKASGLYHRNVASIKV